MEPVTSRAGAPSGGRKSASSARQSAGARAEDPRGGSARCGRRHRLYRRGQQDSDHRVRESRAVAQPGVRRGDRLAWVVDITYRTSSAALSTPGGTGLRRRDAVISRAARHRRYSMRIQVLSGPRSPQALCGASGSMATCSTSRFSTWPVSTATESRKSQFHGGTTATAASSSYPGTFKTCGPPLDTLAPPRTRPLHSLRNRSADVWRSFVAWPRSARLRFAEPVRGRTLVREHDSIGCKF